METVTSDSAKIIILAEKNRETLVLSEKIIPNQFMLTKELQLVSDKWAFSITTTDGGLVTALSHTG